MNAITAYEQKWAAQAAEQAAYEKVKGAQFLSTQSGELKLGDEAMPGNQVCAIILEGARLNTYYGNDGRYDPRDPKAPICYAFGRGGEAIGPHPSMQQDLSYFSPQNATCEGCPMNEWNSAPQGRGKACQNRRQLMLIPAGYYAPRKGSRDMDLHLFESIEQFQTSDPVGLRLPVTSVEEWAKYVNMLAQDERRPPEGVITRIYTEPHQRFQYLVKFELVERVPDELIPVIMARAERAQSAPFGGFRPPEDRAQAQQRGAAPRRSLRG